MTLILLILTPLCSISFALLARYAHHTENKAMLGVLAFVVGTILVAYLLLDDTTAFQLLLLGNLIGVFVPLKWNPLIRSGVNRSAK